MVSEASLHPRTPQPTARLEPKEIDVPASAPPLYQLKITLDDIRPPVWRLLLVPADVKLSDLHEIIQAAFDWGDYHLHVFTSDGVDYGVPSPDDWQPVRDERRARLKDLLKRPRDRMTYVYDFGDSWEHRIVLEKVLPADPAQTVPTCLGGKRACPPEDCGGAWGYAEFLRSIADPAHEQHDEYLEWVGGAFDPEEFSREVVNISLGAIRRKPRARA